MASLKNKSVSKTNIFRKVLWFHRRATFDLTDLYGILQPRRTVSDNPRYKSGLFRSDKCGRDIQYESGLELEFIQKYLESNDEVSFYWEQPVAIPYRRGKIRAKTTPDFGVYLRSRHFVIVEVKPLAEMIDHRVQAKAEGIMEFCSRRGFGFLLTDGKHTPADLLKGKVNRKLEKELSAALDGGVLRQMQCNEIMERCEATQAELYRALIRLDLKFKPYPFKLQRGYRPVLRSERKVNESTLPDPGKGIERGKVKASVYSQVYFEGRSYDEVVEEAIGIMNHFNISKSIDRA